VEEQVELSRQLERRLGARVAEGRELQGEIKKTMKTIEVKCPNLYEQLRIIVNTKFLSDDEDAEPTYDDFSHKVYDFALVVQAAFTEANFLMARQAGLLDKFQKDLLAKIMNVEYQ